MNDAAVEALVRGLGEDLDAPGWLALGPLVEIAPERPYDSEEMRRLWSAGRGADARGLEEALDWVRGAL